MLYFDFYQLFHSDIAEKNNWNNTTSDPRILTNLMNLTFYLLNPLREKLGKPLIITAGYRCEKLREYLKASKIGHPEGMCADLRVNNMLQKDLFDFIHKSGLEYDQLILEYNQGNVCVHIGYNKGHNRKQAMIRTIENGSYKYTAI